MEIKDLESKVWFRSLKVLFVFAYIATFIVVLVLAYSLRPTATDNNNSVIVCDNGKEYKAGDNGIDAEEAWAEQLGATRVDLNGATPAKDKATMLCLGNPSTFPVGQAPWELKTPPYKVELVKKTVWWIFIGYMALALFIVIVIFELIKRSFLYITIGKKFL